MKKLVLLLFLVTALAIGQKPKPASNFEVATIRRTAPNYSGGSSWSPPGIGSFTATNVNFSFLLRMAYGVDESQIVGKLPWMNSDRFDLVAKAPEGTSLTRDELKPMLQALLVSRFGLSAHKEMRELKGFALVVDKNGIRLPLSSGDKPPNFRIFVGAGRIEGINWSLSNLALMLRPAAGYPVIDKTGLSGSYDVHLRFNPDVDKDSEFPPLSVALREQAGLKLEPSTVSSEVLVVDSSTSQPSEN